MNTENTKTRKEKAKSNAYGFGPMGHGMSEMMKCCTEEGGLTDCLTMMEKMKKQCCAPDKDASESERKMK